MENLYYTTTLLYLQALLIAKMIEGEVIIPPISDQKEWIAQDALDAKELSTHEKRISY